MVESTTDPVIIEHTNNQIKNIERIHKDIKRTLNNKDCYTEANKAVDCLNDSRPEHRSLALSMLKGAGLEKPSQTVSERQSLEAAIKKLDNSPSHALQVGNKRRKVEFQPFKQNTSGEEVFGLNTTLTTAYTKDAEIALKKTTDKTPAKASKRSAKAKDKENETTVVRTSKRLAKQKRGRSTNAFMV